MGTSNDLRFEELGEKIRVCRSALQSPENLGVRADLLKALADALLEEHRVSVSVELVEEAITIYEEVSEIRPSGHQQHAQAVSDLGIALERFCVYHGEDRPWPRGQQCIELLRESLKLHPPGHPLRDQALHCLARAVCDVKHEAESERLRQLTESISLGREALQLRPVGHPDQMKSLNNLSLHLGQFHQLHADQQVLEEMIATLRQVIQMCPPGHANRPSALMNLATGLRTSFEQHGSIERLTEAICLFRESMLLYAPGHPERHMVLDGLAYAIYQRAQLQGGSNPEPFFEYIALEREALKLLPARDAQRAPVMGNLCNALMNTIRHGFSTPGGLAEVIDLQRESLRLQRLGDAVLDGEMNNLADALAARFDLHKDHNDLLESISLHRQTLQLRPTGHWRRWESLQRLANLLCRPESRSWPEAFSLLREALQLCPSGFSERVSMLSDMSRCFLELFSPHFDLSEGISLLSEAHLDQFCHVNARLKFAVSNLRRVEEALSATTGGQRSDHDGDITSRVLNLYIDVIGLLPRVANFGLDHSTRLQAIIGSDEIARNAAARALHLERIPHAVEMLEEGRGIFWSQTLHLRDAGFDGVPDKDRQKLERLLQLLEVRTRRTRSSDMPVTQREQDLESRRKLNEEAEALITTIRGYPGLARFLMPAAFSDLVSALPGGYVVILNSSTLGQHALLLNRATGLATSLELQACHREFDSDTIRSQVDRNALREENNESVWDDTRAMKLSMGRLRSLDDTLALLWNTIVRPVFEKLHIEKATGRARPRLWWCVTGQLGFLPIHAAGRYRGRDSECTADYVVSSYIPTLSALSKSRIDWQPLARSGVSGIVVCEPLASGMAPLPKVTEEVRLVRECFQAAQASIINPPSTHMHLREMTTLLTDTPPHILHLACHGVQDPDPLKSAFVLQDGRFTIEDIMQLNMPHAVLAFLSACKTAKGDRNAPDQAVHLAASMLFCGFRSVIGTMWSMYDADGPKVARTVYEILFQKDHLDLDDVPYALDEAVQSLRNSRVESSRWALFMHMGG